MGEPVLRAPRSSSLFNLLTQQHVAAENYPFCTIDPTEAKCPVPDQRFKFLCDLYKPVSKVPAALSVTDIAGLIKGASEGAGLGNAFLSHIAAVDGIFHLRYRCNPLIYHIESHLARPRTSLIYQLTLAFAVYQPRRVLARVKARNTNRLSELHTALHNEANPNSTARTHVPIRLWRS